MRIILPKRLILPRWPTIYDRDQAFSRRKFQYVSNGVEVCSLLTQWQDDHGWQRRLFLLLRHLNDHDVVPVPVAGQRFIVSPTGSNQTITSDATWTNTHNFVALIAGGGSGASLVTGGNTDSGGGGGAYNSFTNFTFAIPGTTTAVVRVGAGGTAVASTTAANGNAGGQSWFNSTAFPVSGIALGAANGVGGVFSSATSNGGAGGAVANNYPANQGAAGGRGGNATFTTGNFPNTGGGGAGGLNGAGQNGQDQNVSAGSNGGAGDNGFGGAGGITTGVSPGSPGGNGREWDSTHGSGGGGSGEDLGTTGSAGTGGLYGGGGGSIFTGAGTATSGAGGQGIVVMYWGINPTIGFIEYDT